MGMSFAWMFRKRLSDCQSFCGRPLGLISSWDVDGAELYDGIVSSDKVVYASSGNVMTPFSYSLLLGTFETWNFGKCRKLSCVEDLIEIWDFWLPCTCETWNFCKCRNWVVWKIWLKFEIFYHRVPMKHEILANTENWVVLKIWLTSCDFLPWPLGPAKYELLANWENSVTYKIGLKVEIYDHRGPAKHELWVHVSVTYPFYVVDFVKLITVFAHTLMYSHGTWTQWPVFSKAE